MDKGYAEVKWFDVCFASALLADAAHCGWTCRSPTQSAKANQKRSRKRQQQCDKRATLQTLNTLATKNAAETPLGNSAIGPGSARTRTQRPHTRNRQLAETESPALAV